MKVLIELDNDILHFALDYVCEGEITKEKSKEFFSKIGDTPVNLSAATLLNAGEGEFKGIIYETLAVYTVAEILARHEWTEKLKAMASKPGTEEMKQKYYGKTEIT